MTTTPTVTSDPSAPHPLARHDAEPPPRFRLILASEGRSCALTASGTLDAASSVAVESQHDQLVEAGFDDVVLDLTGLRCLDESGAVALAQLWARLRQSGVVCRVQGLHPVFADSPLELLLYLRSGGTQMPTGALRSLPRPA
jgi:anti-anti-sigma regulatory factor